MKSTGMCANEMETGWGQVGMEMKSTGMGGNWTGMEIKSKGPSGDKCDFRSCSLVEPRAVSSVTT